MNVFKKIAITLFGLVSGACYAAAGPEGQVTFVNKYSKPIVLKVITSSSEIAKTIGPDRSYEVPAPIYSIQDLSFRTVGEGEGLEEIVIPGLYQRGVTENVRVNISAPFMGLGPWRVEPKWQSPFKDALQLDPTALAKTVDRSPQWENEPKRQSPFKDTLQLDPTALAKKGDRIPEWKKWQAVLGLVDVATAPKPVRGYLHFRPNFVDYSTNPTLRLENWRWRIKQEPKRQEEDDKKLINNYKINLMPTPGAMTSTLVAIVAFLKQNPEIAGLIGSTKVLANYGKRFEPLHEHSYSDKKMNPGVIIKVPQSRDKTQQVLNALYEHFKGVEGAQVPLNYNGRVTDLIRITQGDSRLKSSQDSNDKAFYLALRHIYYAPYITGKKMDFCLSHPETGKEIVQ